MFDFGDERTKSTALSNSWVLPKAVIIAGANVGERVGSARSTILLVGAVVGGAIGNAVGHNKTNKKVGAVVGAVLGGTIGKAVATENRRYERTEEVCRVINDYREEDRIVGYHVKYRYNDVTYTTRTDRAPGETIKLRLAVSPVI